jgi:hypothetical protein
VNRATHTHLCPKCDQQRGCHAAENGGCTFPSSSPVTCERCAKLATNYDAHQLRAMLRGLERITGQYGAAERVAVKRELRRRGEPLTEEPTE